MDEVRQWQTRPLEPLYPIVYVDCLMVNVRENQRVLKKALYLVLAIDLNGQKDAVSDVDRSNGGSPRSGSRC
jgi:putative transposase